VLIKGNNETYSNTYNFDWPNRQKNSWGGNNNLQSPQTTNQQQLEKNLEEDLTQCMKTT
jgi:hypothetical protein